MIKDSNKVVSIVVSKELLTQIDDYCDKMNIKRTAFFNMAVSLYMQAYHKLDSVPDNTNVDIKK